MQLINALVDHEVELLQLNTSIEEVIPLLNAISPKKGWSYLLLIISLIIVVEGKNGREYTLYRATPQLLNGAGVGWRFESVSYFRPPEKFLL